MGFSFSNDIKRNLNLINFFLLLYFCFVLLAYKKKHKTLSVLKKIKPYHSDGNSFVFVTNDLKHFFIFEKCIFLILLRICIIFFIHYSIYIILFIYFILKLLLFLFPIKLNKFYLPFFFFSFNFYKLKQIFRNL